MATGDNNKVVKLRQPQSKTAAGVVPSDDPMNPKSLLNMTDVEQDMFLNELRERRLRAARLMQQAEEARRFATSAASSARIERKAAQVAKQHDKASKALDRLEELIYDLRALVLQHTDIDIEKGPPA